MSLTKEPQKYIRNCSWVRAPEDGDPKAESLGEEGGVEGKGGGPGRRAREEGAGGKSV